MLLPTGDDDNTPAWAEETLMDSHKAHFHVGICLFSDGETMT